MARSRLRALNRSLVAVAAFAGCTPSMPPQPALEIGIVGHITSYDTASALRDPSARILSYYVFQTLPQILRSVTPSRDRRTWTLVLDAGRRFADGTPLDAAAVYANVARWRDVASSRGANLGFRSAMTMARTTVVLKTDTREDIVPMLSDPRLVLEAPASTARPIGSGRYEIAELVPGSHVFLRPSRESDNENPAAFASIAVREIPDPRTSLLSLEKGDLDIVYAFPADLVPQAREFEMNPIRGPGGLFCAFAIGTLVRDRACLPDASVGLGSAERKSP